MTDNAKDGPDIPSEFRNDPVLAWADSLTENQELQAEESFIYFLELLDKYGALLRRFSKVLRISDGYQREIKDMNLLLNEAARTDYLTGLSNRRDVIEKLGIELSRARRHSGRFSLLLADIDSFKSFNDRLGHEAGDEVIKAVALSMKANLRKEDLCARWGGEEFLICLPSIEPQSAVSAAEKIRAGVESLVIEYGKEKLSTSISIGVAHYREDVDLDALIRDADQAMIGAKRAGKNRTFAAGQ